MIIRNKLRVCTDRTYTSLGTEKKPCREEGVITYNACIINPRKQSDDKETPECLDLDALIISVWAGERWGIKKHNIHYQNRDTSNPNEQPEP